MNMPNYEIVWGRREAPDSRDKNFPMRLQLDPFRQEFFPRGLPTGSRHYRSGSILDQGSTGTCVAHGWSGKYQAAPIMQSLPLSPYDVYRQFVLGDEWQQNDFEATAPANQLQFGTSVRAGAKWGQANGYLKAYLWAEQVEDARAWHLAGFGGCVVGINWPDGMMRTDSTGFVRYEGTGNGGHCFFTTGWNDRVKWNGKYVRAVRGQNSWSKAWGDEGKFWMLEDDFAKAMADHGEVCAATELKFKKP